MILLVAGLVLFLGIHLVPVLPPLRASVAARMSERSYKLAFSAISGIGLVLIVVGVALAPRNVPLFAPSSFAIVIAPPAMAIALTLLAAANLKGHIRRFVRHPMLAGVILWSAVHLCANGDVASTVLFGAFLAWALVDLVSAIARRAVRAFEPRIPHDAIAVVAGSAAAFAIAILHRVLFGVRVVPFGL
ncbi:MAG: NnrU family protein [Betaproteobacteria bacterium]